jgi:protein gp37
MTNQDQAMLEYIRTLAKRLEAMRVETNETMDRLIAENPSMWTARIENHYRHILLPFIDEKIIIAFSKDEDIVLTRLQAEDNGSYHKTD